MVTTRKTTSNEHSSHTMPKNYVDTTTLLMEMKNELEDLKRKNVGEIENLETIKLKPKEEDS